jgi:tetratricopeptide (TPR) repeat protein
MNRQPKIHITPMLSLAVVFLCAFWPASVFTQDDKKPHLHSPAEIMKIMEESDLIYEIDADYVPAPVDSPVVLSNQMYLRKSGGGYDYVMYALSDQALAVHERAEEAFRGGQYVEAITQYERLREVQPDYAHALTLIGDAYFCMQRFDSAEAYFLRAIDANYIDYDAHWFLADTYGRTGDVGSAVREATIAHVLNANHANLQNAIRHHRRTADRPWKEWSFTPEYTLSRDGNKVVIKTTPEWMGYAMVKAVWEYEPGYAASMLDRPRETLAIVWPEEKEAIMTLLIQKDKFPRIDEIVEKGYFQEFVLYEITARRHPSVLVLLPREDFLRVVEYVNLFH